MTSQRLHDSLDDRLQMRFAVEFGRGPVLQAFAFNENMFRTVDHDLGNGRVAQKRGKRTEADQVVHQRLPEQVNVHIRGNLMPDFPEDLVQGGLHLRTHGRVGKVVLLLIAHVEQFQHACLDAFRQLHHAFRKKTLLIRLSRVEGKRVAFVSRNRIHRRHCLLLRRERHAVRGNRRIRSDHEFEVGDLQDVARGQLRFIRNTDAVFLRSGMASQVPDEHIPVLFRDFGVAARNAFVRDSDVGVLLPSDDQTAAGRKIDGSFFVCEDKFHG